MLVTVTIYYCLLSFITLHSVNYSVLPFVATNCYWLMVIAIYDCYYLLLFITVSLSLSINVCHCLLLLIAVCYCLLLSITVVNSSLLLCSILLCGCNITCYWTSLGASKGLPGQLSW